LEAKGLRVLERNVVLGRLELDLVCEDGDTLVFVEVKTRAEGSLATPATG
jgi:Predicted endonuclease distantly related to archaeal Holliday junction resolvase